MSSLVPIVTLLRDELGISFTQMGVILAPGSSSISPPPRLRAPDRPHRPEEGAGDRRPDHRAFRLPAQLCRGFWSLFAAVALFGLGGPIVSIGLPKLVVDWFSGPNRGLASGIYITGPALGSVLVLASTHAFILPLTGSWRITLALYAAIALIVAALWIAFGRDSAQNASDRERSGAFVGGYREVIFQPAVWTVIIVGFSAFLASHGLRSWLPQILEARGMSPAMSGVLASLPAVTGVLGSILILGLASRGAGSRRRATLALLLVTGSASPPSCFSTAGRSSSRSPSRASAPPPYSRSCSTS